MNLRVREYNIRLRVQFNIEVDCTKSIEWKLYTVTVGKNKCYIVLLGGTTKKIQEIRKSEIASKENKLCPFFDICIF